MSVQEEVDDMGQVVDGSTANGAERTGFLTAKQVWSDGTEDAGGCALVSTDPVASSSEYYSTRTAAMMEREGESSVEREIDDSRDHWSELQAGCGAELGSLESNRAVFRKLQKQYGGFFEEWDEKRYEIGEKLAEGAQGAIHECLIVSDGQYSFLRSFEENCFVLKVFKMEGVSLEDLQKQWPAGMLLKASKDGVSYWNSSHSKVRSASMLKDGSFVFMMPRCWGDLRKLIEVRMKRNKNQAPPFILQEGLTIMRQIADGMQALHEDNIVHRDLKASNVLVLPTPYSSGFTRVLQLPSIEFDPLQFGIDHTGFVVADFECSVGVVGTGFWRAPEILRALKNRDPNRESFFTEKSDVYSYAMTCYEVLTGKIPFDGKKTYEYDVVLGGERPILPKGTEPWVQSLLSNCWDEDPCKRPSFREIVETLKREMLTEEIENLAKETVKVALKSAPTLQVCVAKCLQLLRLPPSNDLELVSNDRFYPTGLGLETSDSFQRFRNRKVKSVAKSSKN